MLWLTSAFSVIIVFKCHLGYEMYVWPRKRHVTKQTMDIHRPTNNNQDDVFTS